MVLSKPLGERRQQLSYPAVNPVNYNNNLPEKSYSPVQYWHDSFGGNQPLFAWIWGSPRMRESMPNTANSVKNLLLKR